ncbi:carbonic anhydrase 4-like [Astyanax mexicanus]|uniref:Carbonic anhydrase n=1 Tax=Astyanax mexicanus TaxID=7994 RepID=A0A8B9LXA6_ASTMX|nr:carbonic anhydrase 4-like [Astyanax mexicanus]
MQALISSVLLLASILKICTSSESNWCYQTQVICDSDCKGPDVWHEVNEECSKSRQSPINIVTKKTKLNHLLTPLKFTGYQEAFRSTLKNNGHSVTITVPHVATVSEGNLLNTYRAVQFHFHWGEDGGPGSEHTVDGEQYPMEMHIVHMRQDFKNLDAALGDPTGVAVLGFFYEESASSNRKYDGFIEALKNVVESGSNTTIDGISLSNLIPSEGNMTNYYRYSGSLTTPSCTEAVVWTVFENPIPLSHDQLSAFSNLKFHGGKSMVKTFRPVQPRKGRVVYRSGSSVLLASFTLLLLCVTSALGLSQFN